MAVNDFRKRVIDAMSVKFRAGSPNLDANLKDLLLVAGSGKDAILRTVLNSAVGGAGPQPLESEIVEGADPESRLAGVGLVVDRLLRLREEAISPQQERMVSVLISRLQVIAG